MRLLYFSPVRTGSYAQRPHFMVRAWLERGVESVLWVNPHPCRLPTSRDLRRARGLDEQGTTLDPRVRVLDVPALPIEPLPLGGWLNRRCFARSAWRELERFADEGPTLLGIGRPSALALAALREFSPSVSFYDAMDNFPEFHGGLSRLAMLRRERAIASRVDLVIASSTFLVDKFTHYGVRVEKVLNACEAGERQSPSLQISKSPNPNPPSPAPHPPSTPVLGYVGCLGRWFDWPLVVQIARSLPEARIELVGPCAVAPPRDLPENIQLLPACRHTEIAAHVSRFSVGLIPFRLDALTAGVDPIKYYEYRAAGLPVLSTRFGEMAFRGREDGVFFLDRIGDMRATVAAAMAHHDDRSEIERFRRENDWRRRFQEATFFRGFLSASPLARAA